MNVHVSADALSEFRSSLLLLSFYIMNASEDVESTINQMEEKLDELSRVLEAALEEREQNLLEAERDLRICESNENNDCSYEYAQWMKARNEREEAQIDLDKFKYLCSNFYYQAEVWKRSYHSQELTGTAEETIAKIDEKIELLSHYLGQNQITGPSNESVTLTQDEGEYDFSPFREENWVNLTDDQKKEELENYFDYECRIQGVKLIEVVVRFGKDEEFGEGTEAKYEERRNVDGKIVRTITFKESKLMSPFSLLSDIAHESAHVYQADQIERKNKDINENLTYQRISEERKKAMVDRNGMTLELFDLIDQHLGGGINPERANQFIEEMKEKGLNIGLKDIQKVIDMSTSLWNDELRPIKNNFAQNLIDQGSIHKHTLIWEVNFANYIKGGPGREKEYREQPVEKDAYDYQDLREEVFRKAGIRK